ncbi:MAG: hypothetical protein ACP5HG_15695 [Anaerolineae bacterium]
MSSARAPSSAETMTLTALYRQTGGERWHRNDGWTGDAQSARDPCSWAGVTCEAGRITGLALPRNALTGTLPVEIGLLAYLRHLDLADNRLTGAIPPALGNLRELVALDLSDNDLHGPIPARLRLLRRLRTLDLHGNALSGPIPAGLHDLRALERLDLSDNRLTGELPPELGRLRRLVSLSLHRNALSGPLPATLTELKALAHFSFDDTELVEPPDPEVQAWLAGIDDLHRTGVLQTEVVSGGNAGLAALAGVSTLGATLAAAWLVLLPLLGPVVGPIVSALSSLGGVAGAGLVARRVYELTQRQAPSLPAGRGRAGEGNAEGLRAALASELRDLVRTARRDLPPDAVARLDAIEGSLLGILARLERPDSADRDPYLVRQTIRDYLPEALAPYRVLPADFATVAPIRGDETAHDALLQQLDLIQRTLDEIDARLDQAEANRLLTHGRFLKDKLGQDEDALTPGSPPSRGESSSSPPSGGS